MARTMPRVVELGRVGVEHLQDINIKKNPQKICLRIFRTRLFGLEWGGGFKEPSTMFRTRLARTGERGGMGLFGAC